MIACTSTAIASRRKSTSPSTPRLRSSPRTSMLSLTTSSPPRVSTVFARENDAVVSLSLDLCYTTSWDSTILYSLSFDNKMMSRNALSARQSKEEHVQGMLNVAFTRARDELHVFHSAPISDFTFADGSPGPLTDWLAHCAIIEQVDREVP